jgi:hypothetical protein
MASRNTLGVALITGVSLQCFFAIFGHLLTFIIGRWWYWQDVANSFAETGAVAVVFVGINKTGAEEAAQEAQTYSTNPKFKTLAISVDISDEYSVQAMVNATLKGFLALTTPFISLE